jgi:hypothetical protein
MGAFGLLNGWHDHLVASDQLVEAHPMLDVHLLEREGLLVAGTEAQIGDLGDRRPTLEAGKARAGESAGQPINYRVLPGGGQIELDSQFVSVSWHRALKLRVFICGICGRDCYKLYRVGTWACRRCHRLDYASRHRSRTIPGLIKLRYLRRRIAAPAELFSPLPAKPKPRMSAIEHLRLSRQIRQLEQALIEHSLRHLCVVLEKRYGRSRSGA